MFDDLGNSEILTSGDDGRYQTKAFEGVIGRQYFIRIETLDGKIYESTPETMNPSGSVDSVYYEIESHQPITGPMQYGFRIFADFSGYADNDNLYRWKFTGTYRVVTHPELFPQGPLPCSGLIFDLVKRDYVQRDTCTCCICWPNLYERIPLLSDNSLSQNGQFKKIEVGYVPLDYWLFLDKTMVVVEQLAVSQQEYAYWSAVKRQMVGAADLFQLVNGKVKSNIFAKNGTEEVYGYFSVAGTSKKIITLSKNTIPPEYSNVIPDPEEKTIPRSCMVAFSNSPNKPPYYWR